MKVIISYQDLAPGMDFDSWEVWRRTVVIDSDEHKDLISDPNVRIVGTYLLGSET